MQGTLIEKEEIASLHFPKESVEDVNCEKKQEILAKLDQALNLGNSFKHKVKISFSDDTNKLMVETTVWALTEKNIVLKAGVTIPIHRVHSISIIGPIED